MKTAFPTEVTVDSGRSGWEDEKLSDACDGQTEHDENLESQCTMQEGLWYTSQALAWDPEGYHLEIMENHMSLLWLKPSLNHFKSLKVY